MSCICFLYLVRKVSTGRRVLIHCMYTQSEYLICLAHFLFHPRRLVRGTRHLSETKALFLYLLSNQLRDGFPVLGGISFSNLVIYDSVSCICLFFLQPVHVGFKEMKCSKRGNTKRQRKEDLGL